MVHSVNRYKLLGLGKRFQRNGFGNGDSISTVGNIVLQYRALTPDTYLNDLALPATEGQQVATILDISPNGFDAHQSVGTNRGTWNSSVPGVLHDAVDDFYDIIFPFPVVGTLVIGTDQGIAAYDVSIPAGTWYLNTASITYMSNYPTLDVTQSQVVLYDSILSDGQVQTVVNEMIADGCSPVFGETSLNANYLVDSAYVTKFRYMPLSDNIVDMYESFGFNLYSEWPYPIPSSAKNLYWCWQFNPNLTVWTTPIPNGVTDLVGTWLYCNLASWTVSLPDSIITLEQAWMYNQLTSWSTPLPSNVTNIRTTWLNNKLTSWTTELPSTLVYIAQAWQQNFLTGWSVSLPNSILNMSFAWALNRIEEWTTPLPVNVQHINGAWASNRLTSWSVAIPSSVVNATAAWGDNLLTSWSTPLPSTLIDLEDAWNGNALDQTSVDYILTHVNSFGTSNGKLGIQGGTNATPSAAGQAATDALRGRGWIVTLNGY